MRFSLQHVLVWQAGCLAVIAGNVALGGVCDLSQGLWTLGVCGLGCAWGIWRFGRKHPEELLAPMKVAARGMVVAVVLSLGVGLLMGSRTYEVCTRTLCSRSGYDLGVLNWKTVNYSKEAEVVRDELHYAPREHHWVMVTSVSRMWIAVWFPSRRYPVLELEVDDLRRLAKLEPVEKCQVIFEWENEWDLRPEIVRERERVVQDLKRGPLVKSDTEFVRKWWTIYEPILRPMRSEAAYQTEILSWRRY